MLFNYKIIIILLFSTFFIFISCQRKESSVKTKENSIQQETSKSSPNADKINKIPDFVLRKQVNMDKYKISLSEDTVKYTNKDHSFWNIYLIIEDTLIHKTTFNQSMFVALPEKDSVFNRVDLDNDGKLELIVIGSREMTSYTFQQGLIIDFKIKPEPILIVNDPTIIKVRNSNLLKTEVRGSPSVLVFGYNYSLKYSNGKLLWEYIQGVNSTNCLCGLDKKDEFNPAKNLNLLYSNNSLCENDASAPCLEMYLLDKILSGKESEGWAYFDKIYKCKDKKEKQKSLKEELESDLKYIKENDYKFE